jgi:hypothetical protein
VQAAVLGLGLAWPACGIAQTAPSPDARPGEPAEPTVKRPSIGHSMAKGATLKIGTTFALAAVYFAGTGSMAATGMLTAINTLGSYAIYVGNEYLWDTVAPVPDAATGAGGFDASASLWRNTGKYLTFKPAVAAFGWASVYWYTGSVASMVTMGSVTTLVLPAVFYINNVGWDWYDWYSRPADTGSPHATTGSTGPRP